MRMGIHRYGAASNVGLSIEEKRGNDFFRWLSTLSENNHGQRCLMPTGFQCTWCAHDCFGEGDAYLRDEGQWLYLPATSEQFKGMVLWLANGGRRTFATLHYGDRGEDAVLLEITPLQVALPPLGIKIDGDKDGIVLPRAPEVGCLRGEKIDGLLSDERSQCHIRVFTESEKVKGQDGNVQEREWVKVEIGMPRLSTLMVNPPNDPFTLMFGN